MSDDLPSWKAIAHHLGVNLPTAQRWETERSLPVRRLPGGHGRVAITKVALDVWQKTATPDTTSSRNGVVCYRWPLGRQVNAELRLSGPPTIEHLNRLRQYLDLVQQSLQE